MAAIYDIQVKLQLDEYDIALKGYPISAARRKEKVKRLRLFLQSLSKDFSSYAICNSKKLGQQYTSTNNIVFANLRQTRYEDESGTQWRMSFLQVSKNVVKIYRLYQAQFVDESYYRRKIKENTNNTMNKNTQKKTIRLTETKLRSIIAESIKRVLENYDDEVKRKKEIDNAWGEFKYDDPTYVEHNHPNRYNIRDNEYPTFNNALRGINGEEPEIDNEFDANLNIFSDRVGEQGATSMAALGHYGKEMADVAKSIRTTPRQSYQAGTQIK